MPNIVLRNCNRQAFWGQFMTTFSFVAVGGSERQASHLGSK